MFGGRLKNFYTGNCWIQVEERRKKNDENREIPWNADYVIKNK